MPACNHYENAKNNREQILPTFLSYSPNQDFQADLKREYGTDILTRELKIAL